MPRTKPTTTTAADRTLDVLHVIRVAGLVDSDEIADRTALPAATVSAVLADLAANEQVTRREGRMPGWRLTDTGKARHHDLLRTDMGDASRRRALEDLHHVFVPLNVTFKTVCTDWQLRDGAPNDHSDDGYDAAITARLRDVHDQLAPALDAAVGSVGALQSYRPRFAAALSRIEQGDNDAYARPLSGSYHDVWMELHQDLILRLDLQRGDDDA